jgi:hypothetical protein
MRPIAHGDRQIPGIAGDAPQPALGQRNETELRCRDLGVQHGARRQQLVKKLRQLFDLWLGPSDELGLYLGGRRAEHIQVARQLIEIIPSASIVEMLRYLVEDYWGRRSGMARSDCIRSQRVLLRRDLITPVSNSTRSYAAPPASTTEIADGQSRAISRRTPNTHEGKPQADDARSPLSTPLSRNAPAETCAIVL